MKIGTETLQEAKRREAVMDIFRRCCGRWQVSLQLALAIARKETHFQNVRSKIGATDDKLGGAWGMCQITSETARSLGIKPGMTHVQRGAWLVSDPANGIDAGILYLRKLQQRFGFDLKKILAAYNAGPGAVMKNRIPKVTLEKYVPVASAYYEEYMASDLSLHQA